MYYSSSLFSDIFLPPNSTCGKTLLLPPTFQLSSSSSSSSSSSISGWRRRRRRLLCIHNNNYLFSLPSLNNITSPLRKPIIVVCAGRSKKTPSTSKGGGSGGRIEGDSALRRQAKQNARRRSRKLAESLFYRLKNPNRNQADNFSEEELQMIGLGYDRMVRFMDKDDPNLRHPYDWYKYGEYGPYSWRGIVIGDPIRGRFSDECVSMYGEVRDHQEWEEIEQFDMATEFSNRLNKMDKTPGMLKYFWVFVRHPRWNVTELPWEQWTLVCEVAVEAPPPPAKKRLGKWNLMGRFGNSVRAAITQCAAWLRPDIIYVKRPVYQCRFEPQSDFFKGLGPLLDPSTEDNFLFELKREDGRVEMCTYFGGLCKIVKVNPKAFVDDVVKAYEKLTDENKSRCLDFLLTNHPIQLLHPYTKEWKAKLEEMEFGCDAPDEDEDEQEYEAQKRAFMVGDDDGTDDTDDEDNQFIDMESEDDGDGDGDGDGDDQYVDVEGGDDDEELGIEEDVVDAEEDENYWEEEFKKALKSSEAMEGLVKRSVERSTKFYKKQLREKEENNKGDDGVQESLEKEEERQRIRPKLYRDEWDYVGSGSHRRRIKKNRIPPELFLRAAVRPFTYRNLVKEIVLMRHAIIDGDVSSKS